MSRILSLVLALAPLFAWAVEKPRVVVLNVSTFDKSLEAVAAQATEQMMTELTETQRLDVVGSSDLQTMLGLERQKELLGCSEKSQSCMAELGAALGAPWLVAGSVAKAGKAMRIDIKLIRADSNKVVYRSGKAIKDEAEVFDAVSALSKGLVGAIKPPTVAELAASKPPPPPKKEEPVATNTPEPVKVVEAPVQVEQPAPSKPVRVAPLAMMIGGGVVFIAGGVLFGVEGLGNLSANWGGKKTVAEVNQLQTLSTVGLIAAGVGAAVAVGGLIWWLLGSEPSAVTVAPLGDRVVVFGRF